MTTTLIQHGPAYELSVAIDAGLYGQHLRFISFVPTARSPEPQVRFQANLSTEELRTLYVAIGQALLDKTAPTSGSRHEPVAH